MGFLGLQSKLSTVYWSTTLALLLAVISAPAATAAFTDRIYTVAGNGEAIFTGDEQPANEASFSPFGIATTDDGGFLIAAPILVDRRILRASPDGTIKTVAGTGGSEPFNGDGLPATSALLNQPRGVALLGDGGYLIADTENHRIRHVRRDGLITTVAGTGEQGFSGDNHQATLTRLNQPFAVAVLGDGGFLIADSGNHRIRQVSREGTITTIAGTGVQGFNGDGQPALDAELNRPSGVALARDGRVLIVDTSNHRIRKINSSGAISTVAGTGQAGFNGDNREATIAQLNRPFGVAPLSDNGFIIADTFNHRVRRVTSDGRITPIAGTGVQGFNGDDQPAIRAQLSRPTGVAVSNDGRLLVSEFEGSRVRLIDTDLRLSPSKLSDPTNVTKILKAGEVATLAGVAEQRGFSGDTLFASQAQLNRPEGVTVLPKRRLSLAGLPNDHRMNEAGNILVADTGNHRIRKITPDGRIWTVAGTGKRGFKIKKNRAARARLNSPADVEALPDGSFFIADTDNNRIRKVNPNGRIATVAGNGPEGFGDDGMQAEETPLNKPSGIEALPDGRFLIADTGNHIIREVDSDGIISTVAGVPNNNQTLFGPTRVIVFPDGDLLIADTENRRVVRRARAAQNNDLSIIAGQDAGEDITLQHPDPGNGGTATKAVLGAPIGLLRVKQRGILIADAGQGNNRVRRVSREGIIDTVAGQAGETDSFGGDFGPAETANFNRPSDLARHPQGILVADTGNNVIRFISSSF